MISERISHYSILKKLGEGGMGEVYLAADTRLDRKVALKLLPADFTADRDRQRRFEQEAKAASRACARIPGAKNCCGKWASHSEPMRQVQDPTDV